jgi:hypothetical protein
MRRGAREMIRNIATALSFLVTFAGGTAISQENSAVIVKTVSFCVAEVRKLGEWANHFDAFYNSATKMVENNAIYVRDQSALYEFRKCMASQGLPLH